MKMKRMTVAALFLLCFLVLPVLAPAQTTGKISGVVTDKETGEPLTGVNVIVDGTSRGAATDLNGYYFIVNMPPGSYTLKAHYIGYKTNVVNEVRVSVNRTTSLDIQMEQTVLEGETVVVTADPISIKKDQTSSVRNVSSDDIEMMPVEDTGDVVGMQTGVVLGYMRGGRAGEVATLIDGISVSNGQGGSMISVDPDAVQDMEVRAGTISAKYGDAMSGVVNIVTKEGGDTFTGTLRGYLGNYYTANDDIFIGLKPGEVDRNRDIKFTLGGPIIKGAVSFFVNGWVQDNNGYLNGIHRFNVTDLPNYNPANYNNPANWNGDEYLKGEHTGTGDYVPMSWSQSQRFSGKLTWKQLLMKMNLQYIYNKSEGQGYNHMRRYAPYGRSRGHSESSMIKYTLNHFVSKRAFYELKLAYNRDYYGSYLYKNPLDSRYLHGKYSANAAHTNFFTGGQEKGHFEKVDEKYFARLDFNWQASNHHSLEMGAEFSHYVLDHRSEPVMNMFENSPAENYIFAPEVRDDSTVYTDIYKERPNKFAAWFIDKMEFENMVLVLGCRLERFDANTVYPSNYRNPAGKLSSEGRDDWNNEYLDVDPKISVAPVLSFSYQLGSMALLRFSYSHLYQYPGFGSMYQNNSYVISTTDYATTLGNPNVEPEKTVNYEVGLWQQLNDNFDLDVTLWYKDIYNLSTVNMITTYDNHRYGLYGNKDYGNARGLEISLNGRFGAFLAQLNYTLQYTRGNADSPIQNFSRAGNDQDPIAILIPMNRDQRHTLNTTLGYTTDRWGVSATGYLGSGRAFTWNPIDQSRLNRVYLLPNNQKQPYTFTVDLKANYKVGSFYGMDLMWELFVYNLFDRLNEGWVNPVTGRANQSIIRDIDRTTHYCDFASYEESIYDPSAYSAPRLIKMGFGIRF